MNSHGTATTNNSSNDNNNGKQKHVHAFAETRADMKAAPPPSLGRPRRPRRVGAAAPAGDLTSSDTQQIVLALGGLSWRLLLLLAYWDEGDAHDEVMQI